MLNNKNDMTMVISRRILLVFLVLISCSIHTMAQTEYYYYYKGGKIPLTLNENKVVVCIPKDNKIVSERIQSTVQVQSTLKDNNFDIFIILRSDYEKLTSLDTWEEDSKSVIQTPSLISEKNEEVFTTPYLYVRLKSEDDKDLLNSYIEKYKLFIYRQIPTMPLWYILSLTLDSEKGPIECANELWESGDFASSTPEFASIASVTDETIVQSLSTSAQRESPAIFDLQGRRLSGKPAKGVYIENGRKRVK